ncbi:hypothetical protein [Mesomycoplasma ovipneumoniae]|uniref:hypothetical protein n=1 Tax=Mesomycoplasma ovipneumoniae TaxID=29562 RepID=UPI003080D20B
MLKLSKFKIIFGITTFATAVTLPFLILSINEKTGLCHYSCGSLFPKNIADILTFWGVKIIKISRKNSDK